jgi:hypothetical protein
VPVLTAPEASGVGAFGVELVKGLAPAQDPLSLDQRADSVEALPERPIDRVRVGRERGQQPVQVRAGYLADLAAKVRHSG